MEQKSGKLETGQVLDTLAGNRIEVMDFLGEGGQGYVYKIRFKGEEKALKWYKRLGGRDVSGLFYQNMVDNWKKGSPNEAFMWPLDVTPMTGGTFGYVMDLRPAGFYDFSQFILHKQAFPSYKHTILACLQIVQAFRLLHNKGFTYRDLNDGNFFMNPKTAQILICDVDNIAPDGTKMDILGTPRYMAPEVVAGKNPPNKYSDRHSMAVVLFMIFTLTHPLEGKRSLTPVLTPALQEKLYGSDPIFIMDPDNTVNGPDPVIHRNVLTVWPCLPGFIRDIFLRCFSADALKTPARRPAEVEWIRELVRFYSCIVPCSCGADIFLTGLTDNRCDVCGREIPVDYALDLGTSIIPAVRGARICKCQVTTADADDALTAVAQIVPMKGDPRALGFQNLSGRPLNAVTSLGQAVRVPDKAVVPLKKGIQITCYDRTIRMLGRK